MTAFIVSATVLLLLAVAIVLRPLLKGGTGTGVARDKANFDIYRDQFAELENDLRSGVLGAEQFDRAKADLERRVLEEAARPAEGVTVARRGRAAPIAVGVLLPVTAVLLYLQFGSLEGLSVTPHSARDVSSVTSEQFLDMTDKLAARMRENPDDAEGWMMLGRAYRGLERFQEAADALGKAVALNPGNADLLADLAEALALRNGRTLAGEPTRLLDRALKLDPDNDKVLALSGSAAFERKDYKAAIRHWETLLKRPGVSGELAQALSAGIAEARALSTGKKTVAAKPVPGRVSGTVTLDSALRARAAPEDTVFVYARAAQGPRMPLAIVKVPVKDLPYKFSLDDSMAMMPEMKLSAFDEVIVGARVSKSGSAKPMAGDLEGASATVNPGADGVTVVINQVIR
ncbi:MAG TPA: c-type cytochrome biogenesis protein CcmI [Burkholderiales bacterium]|nr:c-type cytochrome biogenesis protein CcmI [Burkholderiales bacterium]